MELIWKRDGLRFSRTQNAKIEKRRHLRRTLRSDRSKIQIGLRATCSQINQTETPVCGSAFPTRQGHAMTYVVTENCIRCKYMDCVEVCPVDCFYAGENMLVINPVSVSIAACANRSARPRRSSPIATTARRLGQKSTRPMPDNGRELPARASRQPMRTSGRISPTRASCFPLNQPHSSGARLSSLHA